MRRKIKDPMDELFGKDIDRFIMDTGPQEKGKYRVIANLHRKKCQRCKNTHFSIASFRDYCIDCGVIVDEEAKLGKKLTRKEQIKLLLNMNLIDKSDLNRWLKQAQKKKDIEFVKYFKGLLKTAEGK